MGEEHKRADIPQHAPEGFGDLAFAAFSFTHARCGEEGTIELRLGERLLVGWCPTCAVLKTFGRLD